MQHIDRRWVWYDVTAEELADKLLAIRYPACNAFRCGRAYWLNDSFGPDGDQEYAIVRQVSADAWEVVRILTCNWLAREALVAWARHFGEDGPPPSGQPFDPYEIQAVKLDTPEQHRAAGLCPHCV